MRATVAILVVTRGAIPEALRPRLKQLIIDRAAVTLVSPCTNTQARSGTTAGKLCTSNCVNAAVHLCHRSDEELSGVAALQCDTITCRHHLTLNLVYSQHDMLV